jgi:hypothetical protein
MASRKMSAASFNAIRHLLPNVGAARLDMARDVLVEGKTYQEAADKCGSTRQAATKVINAVWKEYERYEAAKETERQERITREGWQCIELDAPNELVAQIRALIDGYQASPGQ